MQNKIQIIIVLIAFVCLSQASMAAKKKDVVKISLPNKVAIEILGVDVGKYEVDTSFIAENINRFFMFCKTSNVEEMMRQGSKLITINVPDGKISPYTLNPVDDAFYEFNINERESPNQIVSSKDFNKNLYYLQKHQLEFQNSKFTFKIKFDQIDQLKDILQTENTGIVTKIMKKHFNNKKKYIEKVHYMVAEDYTFEKVFENDHFHAQDQIVLSLGTGLESVKNTWAASFETSMTFSFARKGIRKNSYSLNYEWQYDFSNPEERNINQFLYLGYRHDFSKDPENSKAYTFKLGYLVNKQGNLYNDDTFKLSVSRPLGKDIYIEPQIYFNDFFKDVVPSIKIGIGF